MKIKRFTVCFDFVTVEMFLVSCHYSHDHLFSIFADKSFPNYTLVYNRNVSCGKHKVGLFPAQTWTCADIRVDGMRLAYGLYPGLGVDDKCTETKGFDDVTELCLVMMDAIDIKKELWAALRNENEILDFSITKNEYICNNFICVSLVIIDMTYQTIIGGLVYLFPKNFNLIIYFPKNLKTAQLRRTDDL
ncbi:hypothetical protein KUTeg_000690 [Tegillarca granosa]|uniref:Uncharacterized protein n=1 Tax=Tegillarca granosa TaxID=220873 RepID=A0ABQ9FYC9_TEGGR|nr:hypothetical protein KUTeg_000690 [Tegillarca granosa]